MRAGAPEAAKGQVRKRRARLQGSPGQALTILSQAAVSHPVPGQAKAFRLQKSKFRAPRPAPGREHGAADVRNMDMDKKTGPEPVQDSGETGSPQERDSRHSPRRVSVQYRPLGRHFLRDSSSASLQSAPGCPFTRARGPSGALIREPFRLRIISRPQASREPLPWYPGRRFLPGEPHPRQAPFRLMTHWQPPLHVPQLREPLLLRTPSQPRASWTSGTPQPRR